MHFSDISVDCIASFRGGLCDVLLEYALWLVAIF